MIEVSYLIDQIGAYCSRYADEMIEVEPHRNYEEEYDDALEFLMDEVKGSRFKDKLMKELP
jgi:hypothetical protein